MIAGPAAAATQAVAITANGYVPSNVNIAQAGVQVELTARPHPDAAFAKMGTTKTSTNGAFSFTARPEIRTQFQVQAVDGAKKAAMFSICGLN